MQSESGDDVRMNDEQKANITGLNVDLADTKSKTLYTGNPIKAENYDAHTSEGNESPAPVVGKSKFIPGLSSEEKP